MFTLKAVWLYLCVMVLGSLQALVVKYGFASVGINQCCCLLQNFNLFVVVLRAKYYILNGVTVEY